MRYKYPRTYHTPDSEKSSDDDKRHKTDDHFINQDVVVTIKMDGENCLDGSTIINTIDGDMTIKYIVDNKVKTKVLSYNIEKGIEEYRNIIGYKCHDNEEEWYEIEDEYGNIIRLTSNHYVFLPIIGSYRKASLLNEDDSILLYNKISKIERVSKIENDSKKYDIQVDFNENFFGNNILVHNCTIYNDYIHARSLDSRIDSEDRRWVDAFRKSKIEGNIPDSYRICGENLFFRHTCSYDNLESMFYAFSIWDDDRCLSWDETQ